MPLTQKSEQRTGALEARVLSEFVGALGVRLVFDCELLPSPHSRMPFTYIGSRLPARKLRGSGNGGAFPQNGRLVYLKFHHFSRMMKWRTVARPQFGTRSLSPRCAVRSERRRSESDAARYVVGRKVVKLVFPPLLRTPHGHHCGLPVELYA